MNNENLLKKIKNIKELNSSFDSREKIDSILNDLILDLENAIFNEDVKNTTTKTRNTFCINYHKKILKSPRPVLAYTKNNNGIQTFCDSYFLVNLVEEDFTPIADVSTTQYIYPNTDCLIPRNLKEKTLKIKINELKKILKVYDIITFTYENEKIKLGKKNLINFINFMNYKNDEILELFINNSTKFTKQPLYTKKENGTEGVILPVICESVDESIKEYVVE